MCVPRSIGHESYVSKVLLILSVKMEVFLKLRQANPKHNRKLFYWKRNTQFKGKGMPVIAKLSNKLGLLSTNQIL